MKKKASVLLIVLAIMALGILAWFYGYHNRKSNDNLPSLSLIAEMDEADVNELLVGYRKIQLREVWEDPDETNSNEDVWIINERTALIVSYSNKDKVVVCGFSTEENLNPIVNIVDRTKTEGFPYDMAEEKFFEDGDNEYYFSGIYSHYVIVHYEDGSQEDIVTALNAGRATIADLDKFDVNYKAKSLGVETAK